MDAIDEVHVLIERSRSRQRGAPLIWSGQRLGVPLQQTWEQPDEPHLPSMVSPMTTIPALIGCREETECAERMLAEKTRPAREAQEKERRKPNRGAQWRV